MAFDAESGTTMNRSFCARTIAAVLVRSPSWPSSLDLAHQSVMTMPV